MINNENKIVYEFIFYNNCFFLKKFFIFFISININEKTKKFKVKTK